MHTRTNLDTPAVVINAAGMGSRLGRGIPKALVKVCGIPLIEWQLRFLCHGISNVRLVVGFEGDALAKVARAIRPDITIIHNPHWAETKTAASLSLGMQGITTRCISLDADLLVDPQDFELMIRANQNCIGLTRPNSEQPVYVDVTQNLARSFSYTQTSDFEWTGLVNFNPKQIQPADGNVYEMISPLLPLDFVLVHCAEIDTPSDYIAANTFWQRILDTQYA